MRINHNKDKSIQNFQEACHLFGETDCRNIRNLIDQGKDGAARKVVLSWGLPLCCNVECMRLILNTSNEQAKRWLDSFI